MLGQREVAQAGGLPVRPQRGVHGEDERQQPPQPHQHEEDVQQDPQRTDRPARGRACRLLGRGAGAVSVIAPP
ncbi:hypothetical protein ACFQYP_30775 [Nonomuraea antimicrobica]